MEKKKNLRRPLAVGSTTRSTGWDEGGIGGNQKECAEVLRQGELWLVKEGGHLQQQT